MIFLLIGFLILCYGLKDFKKAFLIFLVFKTFLVTNIYLLSSPGLPAVTLELFMTICFTIMYFMNKDKIRIDKSEFPYKVPFIWLVVAWFISSVFALVGFMSAMTFFIKDLFSQIIIIWLIWQIVTTKKDISFLLKGFTFAFIIICLYGYYEYSLQYNPLVDYEVSLVKNPSLVVDYRYDLDAWRNRGYRLQSVFEHAIGAGMNWCLYIIMVFIMIIKYQWKSKLTNVAIFTSLLSIPLIFFVNSRSPFVFFMIGSCAFVDFRNSRFRNLTISGVAIFIVLIPYFSQYLDNFYSIFDSSLQEDVGGSNVEMRFAQLAGAIEVMSINPIFGVGYKFHSVLSSGLLDKLLGMESIWFSVLTTFGLTGCVSYGIYAFYSLVAIPKKYKSIPIFFISLAYWTVYTLTSVPGFLTDFYFLIIIIIIKLDRFKL